MSKKQAGIADILVAYNDEGSELKRFLTVVADERIAALDKEGLKIQEGDVAGKTEEELVEMTGDYVDSIEIKKEPSKVAEWFFHDKEDDNQ